MNTNLISKEKAHVLPGSIIVMESNYSGGLEWLVGPDKGDGSEPFPQKWRGLPKGTEQQTAALDALR